MRASSFICGTSIFCVAPQKSFTFSSCTMIHISSNSCPYACCTVVRVGAVPRYARCTCRAVIACMSGLNVVRNCSPLPYRSLVSRAAALGNCFAGKLDDCCFAIVCKVLSSACCMLFFSIVILFCVPTQAFGRRRPPIRHFIFAHHPVFRVVEVIEVFASYVGFLYV